MSLLEGLRFSRGDSPLHRLDPRVKFIMTVALFTSAIIFFDLTPIIVIFIAQLPIVAFGRIGRSG